MVSFSLGLSKFAQCPFPSAHLWGFTVFRIFKYAVFLHTHTHTHTHTKASSLSSFLPMKFLGSLGELLYLIPCVWRLWSPHTMVLRKLLLCHKKKKSSSNFSYKNIGIYVPWNTEMKLESFFPVKVIITGHLLGCVDVSNIQIDGLATSQWEFYRELNPS